MREMDFTEKNLRERLSNVNDFWRLVADETKEYIKGRLEQAMREEVTVHVGRGYYERGGEARGYRNGSYARDLLTRYGWIESLSVPRVRAGGFYPALLARYRRRCRAVDAAVLEAFLLGHATRPVRRWFKRVFGAELSPQAVSNIVHELDDEVQAFHRRQLADIYQVIYLDGFEVIVRTPVKIKKVILVAVGVRADKSAEVLSFQVASSEAESWWWGFVSDLKNRGIEGRCLEVLVTDGAPGLLKAVRSLYPRVRHQRCTFHKATDLASHLTHHRHHHRIIADALHIFEASTMAEVQGRLRLFTAAWSEKEPKAVANFLKDFDACLVYLDYPQPLQTKLKTTNPIERKIEEIRRRIIPMRSFNNRNSAERIIYGLIAYVLNYNQDMPQNQFTQFP